MEMAIIWFVIGLVFLLLEIGHPGLFYFLSFSCGSLVALLFSLCDKAMAYQYASFFVASLIACLGLKLLIKTKIRAGRATNAQALVGKKGIVIKEISSHQVGLVKIGGEIWSAKTIQQQEISVNERVEIIEIRGSHVIVIKTKG